MRKVVFLLVVMLLLLSVGFVANAQGNSGRYIILYRANRGIPTNVSAQVAAAGGQLVRTIPQVGIAVAVSNNVNFASNMSNALHVESVGLSVAIATPNVTTSEIEAGPTADDTFYNGGLLWGISRVNAEAAWDAGITGSHDTVVAVIDTGIAWNHPDLGPNVVYVDCYTSAGSYADGACNPYPSLSDHGTHVAGTVAATFGGGGVIGVGPDLGLAGYNTFEVIAGCGVCSYTDSRWAAMVHAANSGYDVISMSLGGTGQYGGQGSNGLATFIAADDRVTNYVAQQGTLIVASAGNSGLNLNGTIIHVPGDLPGVINVGATGIQPAPRYPYPGSFDIPAFYTNYGAAVDISAPGGDCGQIGICNPATRPANWFEYLILSSIVAPSPACAATASCPVGYGWKGGTSMATPHVSGAAALVIDQNYGLLPQQVTSILKQTADNVGSRQIFGHGIVDVAAALGLDN